MRGSNIITGGSYTIMDYTGRLFQCWSSSCSLRRDGSKIK